MTDPEPATATVADVVDVVHRRYDPTSAEAWDAVGLVCGDPGAPVHRVLVAVDAVAVTVDEALALGADLLVTHHPLLLHPVSSVAATTPAGRLVHRLVRAGCALLAAHTNADVAPEGVSDALAATLGIRSAVPLVTGLAGPTTGLGRVGELDGAVSLAAFAGTVREALPATAQGVRVAGDPERRVHRVAVIGGSGGDALGSAARAGADVVVTSDLRHHVTSDFIAAPGGPAVIDVAHFASEWPWVPVVARLIRDDLALARRPVQVHVSTVVTDPWTFHR